MNNYESWPSSIDHRPNSGDLHESGPPSMIPVASVDLRSNPVGFTRSFMTSFDSILHQILSTFLYPTKFIVFNKAFCFDELSYIILSE